MASKFWQLGLIACVLSSSSGTASAGETQKALVMCLVNSATASDKEALAEWLFTAMSLYPKAAKLSPIGSDVRKKVSEAAAAIMQRLITEPCLKEAQATAKAEGLQAVSGSLQIMGEIAGRELLTHPDVTGGMSAVGQFMDAKKIEAAVAPGGPAKAESKEEKAE